MSDLSEQHDTSSRPLLRRTSLLLGWALLGFAAFEAFWFTTARFARRPPNAGLIVRAGGLDLGDQWAQEDFDHVLTIENPTDTDVHVTDFKSQCICTTVEPRSFTIPAGGNVDVKLKINLAFANPPDTGKPSRPLDLGILPKIDGDLGPPEVWHIRGTVKNAFSISSKLLGYGGIDEFVAGAPAQMKSVSIVPYTEITKFEVRCEPALGTAIIDSEPTKAVLRFTPAKSLTPGAFDGEIWLAAVLATGEAVPPVPIKVAGKAVRDIQAVPDELQFGSVDVGGAGEQSLLIHSRAQESLRAVDCVKQPAQAEIVKESDSSARDGSFRVRVRCEAPGFWQSALTFRIEHADGRTENIDVPIGLYGVGRRSVPQAGTLTEGGG